MTRPDAAALALVRDGFLDAELLALTSMAIGAGIGVVVAGEPATDRARVRDALLGLVPGSAEVVRLRGDAETFDWLPEAATLGWQGAATVSATAASATHRTPRGPVVMVADLVESDSATWGEHARLAIRALTTGCGLLATADGARLEDVLGRLAAFPVGAIDDELTRIGIVLILGPGPVPGAAGRTRVTAAHYMRPVARDVSGHVQRLPPAVLATWNQRTGSFDHFAWGVIDELAGRSGRTPVAFEREQAARVARIGAAIGP